MPNKYRTENNDIPKTTTRRLGVVTNIKSFCKKYNIQFRALKDNEDPIDLAYESIQILCDMNNIKHDTDKGTDLFKAIIYSNDEVVVEGYFSSEQLLDIRTLDKQFNTTSTMCL